MKLRLSKNAVFASFLLLLVLSLVAFSQASPKAPPPTPPTAATANHFSYSGQDGQDALTLLKARAAAEQNESGLVVAINGRKANASAREFWAFYVNGELAQVGPADYQTKNADRIEWKIEKY